MPKIVFIEPQAPNLHIFSMFPSPRLGVLILGTMMKQVLAHQAGLGVGITHHARKLNRMRMKRNRAFLRVVALLKPKPGTRISVDYRMEVSLSNPAKKAD